MKKKTLSNKLKNGLIGVGLLTSSFSMVSIMEDTHSEFQDSGRYYECVKSENSTCSLAEINQATEDYNNINKDQESISIVTLSLGIMMLTYGMARRKEGNLEVAETKAKEASDEKKIEKRKKLQKTGFDT